MMQDLEELYPSLVVFPVDYPEIEEHFIYTPNSGANRGPG